MSTVERIERFDVPTLQMLLDHLTPDRAIAKSVLAVLAREIEPEVASAACDAWVRQCHHRPSWHERALAACDDLLGTCGVEGLPIDDKSPFSYCNTGDTYETTLAFDYEAQQWVLASWGDLLEEYERENELGDYKRFDEPPDRCPDCHSEELSLEPFHNATHGDTYAWVCASCNHHCLAVEGYSPGDDDVDANRSSDEDHESEVT